MFARVQVSVLLTDVDVVLTRDPFPALYRDSDVEGMTDGWNPTLTPMRPLPPHCRMMTRGRHDGWMG